MSPPLSVAALARRTSALRLAAPRLPSASTALHAFPLLQTRGKVGMAKKPPPKKKNKMTVSKDPYDRAPTKKEKKLGAFMAMNPAQLEHRVFESTSRQKLDLPTLGPDTLSEGQAIVFNEQENVPMRKFGLPKNVLVDFRLLSKPCSVVREVTVSTVELLDQASTQPSNLTRKVFTGVPGCGKSFLLLQAIEHCNAQGWVVLYVPRAVNLVNSSTTYTYDNRTQIFTQPVFAAQTLQRLLDANKKALRELKTAAATPIERRADVPAGTPIADLIQHGLRDQALAPTVLEAVLAELGTQTQRPVLLAVDDFQALYSESTYRDPLFARIKSYHLSMPRLLLEYASGKRSFARGAVLGALSSGNTTHRLPLELREALNLPYDRPTGAYAPRATEVQQYARGLEAIPVPDKLSVREAAALFELWMKDRALYGVNEKQGGVADEVFLAKYTESSGNARSFVRKGLLSSLAYA